METLPRRGYRWIGSIVANGSGNVVSENSTGPLLVDLHADASGDKGSNGRVRPFTSLGWKSLVALALIIVGLTLAGFRLFPRRPELLTEKDTILIAEFQNRTDNPVFDQTLKQAFTIELAQSPFLNIFPQEGVQETLRHMGRSPDEEITPVVAREICQRRGIRAVLTGSISNLGRNYVIALEARNCLTGAAISQQEAVVQGAEQVLRGLEKAATTLRARLGESLSSIQQFDVSLEQATTSSLEALQAYSLALQKLARGGDTWDALPFLRRATELDSNFAMAYAKLGEIYSSGGPTSNNELANKSLTKAFELRNRVSEREKLYLVSAYYENATRELGKATDGYELWKWTYPRDVTPYDGLAGIYISTGEFEKAADNARNALLLRPQRAISYERLAGISIYFNRLDEAKAFCQQAAAQKLDGPRIHLKLFMIAHLKNDSAAMEKELDWARSRGEMTRVPFYQALVAAANGQLARSEALFQQTMDVRLANHDKEGAALAAVQLALIEAHFGYRARARERSATSLNLLPGNKDLAPLALAAGGDATKAKKPLEDLLKAFPQDTLLNQVIGPVIAAQIELNHEQPKRAIDLLRSAQPFEFGADNAGRGFMAIYLRGEAHLRMHMGTDAAAEFQKIIDHPGIDPFSPLHSLAYLGRARAYALQGDRARTHDTYEEFFTRWKDADSDLPILKQAKAEYANLD